MRIIGASMASAPIASIRSISSAACSRGRVTTMRFPNKGRVSNHCRCWRSATTRPTIRTAGRRSVDSFVIRAISSSVPTTVSCVGIVPLYTSATGSSRFPAVRQQRAGDLGQLLRAGITDNRAVQAGEARPVHGRPRSPVVFVPADEGQRVAAARIGNRNPGVARDRDAGGNTGHHLEPQPLLVQEQRFGAAAVEDERIAPFQARDRLPLARLFREQIADRFLLERLRRGDADVDFLRVGPGVPQQARVHEMVVQHHVGRGETLEASNRDQSGIPGAGAYEVDGAWHRVVYILLQSPARSSQSSADRQESIFN